MKLFAGLIALGFGVAIASVAAFFSVTGLAVLFAAAFWPVIAMGGVLEAGKIVAAGWLHANWRNHHVSALHKGYLSAAIVMLMLITAIGIYGFLAKGHLDQKTPLAATNLQIAQRQQQITDDQQTIQRLDARQAQLDAAVASLIQQNYVIRSQAIRAQQKPERDQIDLTRLATQRDIERLRAEVLPLQEQTTGVEAKLGPVKYVADLFGWTNPDAAVRIVILMIMVAFDPLAIALVISGCISLGEWATPPSETPVSESLYPTYQPIPPIVIQPAPPSDPDDDKQIILAMLKRNPGVIEDVLDTVLEWHEQHR